MGFLLDVGREVFCQVEVPKHLRISNHRLGLLLRLLQIILILWLVYSAATSNPAPWERTSVPSGYSLSIWCDPADSQAVKHIDVRHCNDLSSYAYKWSTTWEYRPKYCKTLAHKSSFKRRPTELFIPTYIEENYMWEGWGSDCTNDVRDACVSAQYAQYSSSGQSCTCTRSEAFFSKNPEELIISFIHGYKVGRLSWDLRPTMEVGRSNIQSDRIITSFKGHDGRDCAIGGSHLWLPQNATRGVSGKLDDFLACGGLSLDKMYKATSSNLEGESDPPHARITGAKIVIELYYTSPFRVNRGHKGPGAEARVRAAPLWNAWNDVTYMQQTGPTSNGTASLTSYAYGISVQLSVHGQVGDFDWYRIIDMCVSALVLLGLPSYFIYKLALYGTGKLSHIYRKAACEHMDIKTDFFAIVCRMMYAASAFRMLSGQSGVASECLQPMTECQFTSCLKECLNMHLDKRTLEDHEFEILARRTTRALRDETEGISLERFVEVCSRNEWLSTSHLVDLFSSSSKRGPMDYLFDDTRRCRRISDPKVDANPNQNPTLLSPPKSGQVNTKAIGNACILAECEKTTSEPRIIPRYHL